MYGVCLCTLYHIKGLLVCTCNVCMYISRLCMLLMMMIRLRVVVFGFEVDIYSI